MRRRKGFTLIELMIVITIILLLLGILVPAVLAALEMAYRVKCAANLEQIGRAVVVYVTTYGGEYPDMFDDANSTAWDDVGSTRDDQEPDTTTAVGDNDGTINSNTANFWALVSRGFCDEVAIFVCPSADYAKVDELTRGMEDDVRDFKGPSYCTYSFQNQFGATYTTKQGAKTALAVAADANPQRADFFKTDPADPTITTGVTPDYLAGSPRFLKRDWAATSITGASDCNSPNHDFIGQNVLYADGHVTWADNPYCGILWDNIWTKHVDVAGDPDPTDITDLQSRRDAISYDTSGTVGNNDETVLNATDSFLVP